LPNHAPADFIQVRPDIAKGKLETIAYNSKSIGVDRKAVVYTPPNYDANKWNINPSKIGIMGFSAGGGVVVGTALLNDPAGYPNFLVSLYGPSQFDVNVAANAPPLFIAAAANHKPVSMGCIALYTVWNEAGKPPSTAIGCRSRSAAASCGLDNSSMLAPSRPCHRDKPFPAGMNCALAPTIRTAIPSKANPPRSSASLPLLCAF
jgi:hypothetical protein